MARDRRYLISEVASQTGFSVPTLRYYERIGLIPAPARTAAGYRYYRDDHLQMLGFIARMKRLGFPLETIRFLVDTWTRRPCLETLERLVAQVDTEVAELRRAIDGLLGFSRQLEVARAALVGSQPHARCGRGCGCDIDVGSVTGGGPGVRARLLRSRLGSVT